MSGYALIYRSLLDHPAFRNDAEAMAFGWMIVKASWRPTAVRYKGHRIDLKRGQLAISQRDMAFQLDRDKGWIERLWKRLKAEAMIEADVKAGVAVITICNYDEYQKVPPTGEAAKEARGAEDKRQRQGSGKAQNNEGNEVKRISPPAPQRGNRERGIIPENWDAPSVSELPPKARACAEQWTPESYATHAEAFVLYWRSERKMKADWRGTWANRVIALHSQVMRDQKFGNAPPQGKREAKAVTVEECENRAKWFDDHGMPDSAADWRRRAGRTRGAAPIGQLLSGLQTQ